jgi:signal transduction histidine kinase
VDSSRSSRTGRAERLRIARRNESLERKERRLEARVSEAETRARHLGHLASVGELAATIAHEVRNPLTGIRAAAELIAEEPANAPRALRHAALIVDEVNRLEHLLQDLREYTRAGRLDLAPCDLRKVLDRSLAMVGSQMKERGVSVTVRQAARVPSISADAGRLQSVFMNLLQNALDAVADVGGRISVRVGPVASKRLLRIVVADNGCGIAPHDVPDLMRAFYTTKEWGTGLGLPITRRIVEDHGGSIEMRPGREGGTEVRVDLPLKTARPVEGAATAGDLLFRAPNRGPL